MPLSGGPTTLERNNIIWLGRYTVLYANKLVISASRSR